MINFLSTKIAKWTRKSSLTLEYCICFLGNGYITTEVLREILQELDNNLTYDDLDQIIEEVDADGSGTVDFEGNNSTMD